MPDETVTIYSGTLVLLRRALIYNESPAIHYVDKFFGPGLLGYRCDL
jgi:hypothetical protein